MTLPEVSPPPTDATSDSSASIREALRRWYNSMFDLWAREKTFLGTFTPSASSTSFTDKRITSTSALLPQPTTANAAAAMNTWWIDETVPRTQGVVTVNHANNAQADRTFRWAIKGA
jgi:hypothetical protein